MAYEKLRDAAAMQDGVPTSLVVLDIFAKKTSCGTMACFGGNIALCGRFGLKYQWTKMFDDDPVLQILTRDGKLYREFSAIAEALDLQHDDAVRLCTIRGGSKWDGTAPPGISDKELIRWRVIQFLREKGEPVSEEYARGW